MAMSDLLKTAWAIIANVNGGDWMLQSKDWQETATRFRDAYDAAAPRGKEAWLNEVQGLMGLAFDQLEYGDAIVLCEELRVWVEDQAEKILNENECNICGDPKEECTCGPDEVPG